MTRQGGTLPASAFVAYIFFFDACSTIVFAKLQTQIWFVGQMATMLTFTVWFWMDAMYQIFSDNLIFYAENELFFSGNAIFQLHTKDSQCNWKDMEWRSALRPPGVTIKESMRFLQRSLRQLLASFKKQ